MALFDYENMLKQLLPPTWRTGWIYAVFNTLLQPLKRAPQDINDLFVRNKGVIDASAQVISLTSVLTSMATAGVYIEHRQTPHTFYVRLPKVSFDDASTRDKIAHYLQTNLLAGTTFQIEFYGT